MHTVDLHNSISLRQARFKIPAPGLALTDGNDRTGLSSGRFANRPEIVVREP